MASGIVQPGDSGEVVSALRAVRLADALGREWAIQSNGAWAALGSTATADTVDEIEAKYGPTQAVRS